MGKRWRSGLNAGLFAIVLVSIGQVSIAQAQSAAIQAGSQWLASQVQTDGSITNENNSVALPVQVRGESALALTAVATSPAALLTSTAATTDTDTESIARRIQAESLSGADPSSQVQALLSHQNPDGGFGTYSGVSSDPLNTAWALIALHDIGAADATVLGKAINYLIQSENQDGGYGAPDGGAGSQVFVSSYALIALQGYASSYTLGTPISNARQWLIDHQTNGVYGDNLTDAIAIRALAATTTDTTTFSAATSAVTGAQLADGSWGDDPYVTAMALEALSAANQPPAPTTGTVSGLVIAGGSHLPIAGAQVQVSGPVAVSTTTGTDGTIKLKNVEPGSYTVSITASGYGSETFQNVQVTAGSNTDLGTIVLTGDSTAGALMGKVTDGASGAAVAGATVSVSGADTASVTTATDGSYSLRNLSAGTITITVTKPNYNTVTATATISTGVTLNFSPALYATGSTVGGTSLTGVIEDSSSKLPVSGAVVDVDGLSATTDSSGKFTVANLATGSFTASVTASGYTGATLTGTLASGVNNTGTILLTQSTGGVTTSTVSGVVTDASNNSPIAGATVRIKDTTLSAVTGNDGSYSIGNISATQFSVLVSAPGYISQSGNISLSAPGNVTANAALSLNAVSGISIKSVTLSQSAYDPYAKADIQAEIDNTTSADKQVLLDAQIIDSDGNVVAEIPAVQLVLGQSVSDAAKTVPASGSLKQEFGFYIRSTPAGTYHVVVQASDINGNVLAQNGSTITINALAQIGGGIKLDPPLSQIGSSKPIDISADLSNLGNLPVPSGQLQLQIKLADLAAQPPTNPQISDLLSGLPLDQAVGAARDSSGNLYVVNRNRDVVKISPDGTATILATMPTYTYVGQNDVYVYPVDIALDSKGTIWVLNSRNAVFKVVPGANPVVTGIDTKLHEQIGFDIDGNGNFLISGMTDYQTPTLEKVTSSGQVDVLVKNGLSRPVGILEDGSGGFLVANYGDGTIRDVDSTGAISDYLTGFNHPAGLARDSQGNLYVAENGANTITKVAADGSRSIFASEMHSPRDITFDGQGNLLVVNSGSNSIAKISPSGVVSTLAQSAANKPEGVAYDAKGDLFIANSENNTLSEIDSAGKVQTVASGLGNPRGVTTDTNGDVYIANYGDGSISKFSGGALSSYVTGLGGPYDMALDGSDNMFVSEYNASRITEVKPDGSRQLVAQNLVYSPVGIRMDANGNMLVANRGFISRLPLNGNGSVVVGGLGNLTSFLQAPDGTIYYRDLYYLYSVDPSTGSKTRLAQYTYDEQGGLTQDAAGNLYIADKYNRRILKRTPAGVQTVYATLPGYVSSATIDSNGNLYTIVGNYNVYKIASDGMSSLLAKSSHPLNRVAVDSNNNVLASSGSAGLILSIAQDGTVTTVLQGLSTPYGLVQLPNGSYAVTESGSRVQVYSSTGALQQTIYGFAGPKGVMLDNGTVVFSDSYNRVYRVTAGHYPTLVANVAADYLAQLNGVFYGTNSAGVSAIAADGSVSSYFKFNNSAIAGLAENPVTGGMAVAVRKQSQIVTLDRSAQIQKTYIGLDQPHGVAIDNSGNVYVSNENYSLNDIVKFDSTGANPSIYVANIVRPRDLLFGPSGSLYISAYYGLYTVDPTTHAVSYRSSKRGFSGLVQSGGDIYLSDYDDNSVRRWHSGKLSLLALGLARPGSVRIAKDGTVYVASQYNNSIEEYTQSGLSVFATGLYYPQNLVFDSSGNLFVSSNSSLTKLSPDGKTRTPELTSLLGGRNIAGFAFDDAGDLIVNNGGVIRKITFPAPVALPAVGSVVYSETINNPGIALGGSPIPLTLGNWTPQYGGDYTVSISSTDANVHGKLVNTLHVGPHAQGELVANKTSLPPGDQSLNLNLSVQGADFTSLSKVDPANLQADTRSRVYPSAMGADANGDIYYLSGSAIHKVAPDGAVSTFASGIGYMRGQIPIDAEQNVYAWRSVSGVSSIIRIDQTGQSKVIATVPGYPLSMAISTDDNIYVATQGAVYHVLSDGSVKLVYNGISSPFSLTVNGTDHIYVLEDMWVQNPDGSHGHPILKITPDGHATTLTSKATFEFEGGNMTGDCADDVFVTPGYWPELGQNGEEHSLIEIVGSTGQAGRVLDGSTVSYALGDMDFIVYDRFHSKILIWSDGGQIYSLPVTCGAIDTQVHVVTQAGQTLSGFDVPPMTTTTHADGSTEYAWDLKDVQTSGQSLNFDTVLNGLQLGDKRTAVQSAFLVFKNTFVPGEVKLPLSIPTVRVTPRVELAASTDKSSYSANSPVSYTIDLANKYGTATQGTLKVRIEDSSGNLVEDLQKVSKDIPPNSMQAVTGTWNTGIAVVGAYKVHAELIGADGVVKAQADAPFGINSGSATTTGYVSAGVSVDKPSYSPIDTVNIDSHLTNVTANALANTLDVVTTVKDPNGVQRWSSTANVAQLVPGALRDLAYSLPLADAPAGTYTVTLSASSNGQVMATSQTSFKVQSSATTGAGLTGTLSLAPGDVPLSQDLTLDGAVTNDGNASISGVVATIQIVDPITQQVIFSSPTTLKTMGQGQSGQFVANWTAAGIIGRSYIAILSAVVNGNKLTLAHQTFKVLPPPIKIDASMSLGTRGRVLILTDDPAPYPVNQDPFGPDQVPGLAEQDQHLAQMLYDAGWSVTIVTNADDFQTQFDTHGYEVYLILSEAVKLPNAMQEKLVAAVDAGEGLIVAGNHDDRNSQLDTVLGAHTTGKSLRSSGLLLDVGGLHLAGGEAAFPVDAEPESVNKVSAAPVGEFLSSDGSRAPAVFTHEYGDGKAVYMAFDLALEEAAAGKGNLFDKLLLDSISYVNPDRLMPYTGSVLPIVLTLDNVGMPTPGRAVVTLPTGVTVIDPRGASVNGNTLTWKFDLTSKGEELPLIFWARMPDRSGSIDISAKVQSGTGSDFMDQTTADLLIGVLPRPAPPPTQSVHGAAISNKSADGHQKNKH